MARARPLRAALTALVLALPALAALAESPATSPRPRPRPVVAEAPAAMPAAAETVSAPVTRPRPRPATLVTTAPPAPEAQAAPETPVSTLRPRPRPEGLASAAPAPDEPPARETRKSKRERARNKGSVCGDPDIRGEKLARITSKVKGCGLDEPVRVTAIDGVQFSQPATIDCATAEALKTWINKGMRPAFRGREVVQLQIAASYICRPRNNVKGNKISEHGRGKAIDISGFVFSDGSQWTVLDDYNASIRKAHKAACGIFGTTLGPGSDGYHENHLHFDTARYDYGPYCR